MGQKLGFQISETKTVSIFFGNKKGHIEPIIKAVHQIKFVKVTRFFGILLDKKLTFGQHIQDMVNRRQKDLNFMRMLKGTDFGTDKSSL
jgi:hypothetical protein